MEHKQYDQAEIMLLKASAKKKSSICFPCTQAALGNAYASLNWFHEAEEQYYEAIQLDSKNAYSYSNMSYILGITKQYVKSERHLRKAIQLDSTNAGIYNYLSDILLNIKGYTEAEKLLKKAIQLDSTFAVSYYNMGAQISLQNNPEEAFCYIDKCLQIDALDFEYYQNDPFPSLLRDRKEQWDALMMKYFPEKLK